MLRLFPVLWLCCLAAGGGLAPVGAAEHPAEGEEGRNADVTAGAWSRGGASLSWWNFANYRFRRGDDPRWAAPDFPDGDWAEIIPFALPSRDGVYWVRWRVRVRPGDAGTRRDGLLFKVVASYDLYWDGRLIGRNGRVGTSAAEERPGTVDALFQLPPELLTPGEHVVALRMSSFHTGFPGPTYGLTFLWGNFRTLLVERIRTAVFSLMAVGAALVVAVVFGLIWLLAGRRRDLLLFSALFLCVGVMQALQAWRWLYDYPYDWHYPRLVTITSLATAVAVLLPAFVTQHFDLPRRGWTFGGLALLLIWAWQSSPIYNRIGALALGIGFGGAMLQLAVAVVRRRRGAVMAAAGLAGSGISLWLAPRDFLDQAFFISVGPAVLGLLVALTLQLRDERREARQAILTAARLEIELLKKNLQPHFLLNTLATIQEVIEQDSRGAVALIDALAAEFRILSRVSGEKLIPLAEELELCRAHLRVMSLRKGAHCTLQVEGVDERDLVPPALFHTLVENGLTHLLPIDGQQRFTLVGSVNGSRVRYVFTAWGRRAAGSTEASGTGTGLRYLRARLEESFPGAWSLDATPLPEGWETRLEFRRATLAR